MRQRVAKANRALDAHCFCRFTDLHIGWRYLAGMLLRKLFPALVLVTLSPVRLALCQNPAMAARTPPWLPTSAGIPSSRYRDRSCL